MYIKKYINCIYIIPFLAIFLYEYHECINIKVPK